MEKIRWGIMGAGRIAGIFCDMLKELEDAQIYAVASRTEEKAIEFGTKYQACKCYGSYEEMMADEQVEIVYVATPIACHYENVKLCLNAGKHVLCEKAFTSTKKEAEELYALAKEKQLFLMEAMWSKCQPVFQKLMEWKKDGKFGEIRGVEGRFYTAGTKDHRLIKYPQHCGSLFDLTVYPLTYACAFLGYEPSKINAVAIKGKNDMDIMESIQLLYDNGSFASLTGGISYERQMSLYIQGTKAQVLFGKEQFLKAEKVSLVDWDNHVIEEFDGSFQVNGYEYEAKEAMRCIREGKIQSALIPMEETIAIIGLMEQCDHLWK